MAYQDALTLLAQLLQLPDAPTSKASVIAMMQAASPPVDATAFILGEPTERWIDAAGTMMAAWGTVPTQATRGMFLRLATDPGDIADDGIADQSADQTPRPGWLSVLGASWFGTTRNTALYATGFITVTNPTAGPVSFKPFDLTFQRSTANSDGGHPTYRNTPNPAIYVNGDGSMTIGAGANATIPIQADQSGTPSSASATLISILVTQSFGALTVSNPAALNGRDREDRSSYINRCFLADASNAPGGPVKAYQRAATTALGGGTLFNYSTGSPVGILGAQVIPDSSSSTVTGYFYGPSGPVGLPTDISTANANILGIVVAGTPGLPNPIGVLPDTVVIGPNVSDPITGSGFSDCTGTTIAVTYSAKIKASQVPGGATPGTYTSGGSPPTPIANIFTSIQNKINAYLPSLGPGGLDQTAGAGFVYTADIARSAEQGQAGLYNLVPTVPAASSTAIAVGHIAVGGTITGTLIVVAG